MDSKPTGRKANLKQYRSVNGKWQFVPVVKFDGKPKPQLVLIDGKPKSSKGGGKFYLEWYENGKRKTKIAGTSPREALDAWQLKTGELSGNVEAQEDPTEETDDTVVTVDAAIEKYLKEVKATKGKATLSAYARDLRWFQKHCKKYYVAKLTRDDIIALFGTGRDEELNQKTINRRAMVALQAMRGAGARVELKKGDWPKTTEVPVEVYEQEELKRFFAACEPDERLLFQVFLCTGFRSQEVATLTWDDVNWKAGTLAVRAKPELGFMPKNYEKRSVPVPRALIVSLKEHRKANPESALVFPTPPHPKRPNYGGEKPDAHALEACKEIAYRAGLNCGRCKSIARKAEKSQTTRDKTKVKKCITGPHCKKWYLHKWRHTFATNMLQSNLDIRSLQILLGHKNIATTEKYLKTLRLGDLRDKVEKSSVAAFL
jgi:integrase